MSTAPWPRPIVALLPHVSCTCGHRVPLSEAFVWGDEQTTTCRSCLLLVACSDVVRNAAAAPRRLPALRPVERTEDEESELDRMVDQLRHLSQHTGDFATPSCHWCLASGHWKWAWS